MEVISISKILGHLIPFIVTYYLIYGLFYYLWYRKEKILTPLEKDTLIIFSTLLTLVINFIGFSNYYGLIKIVW